MRSSSAATTSPWSTTCRPANAKTWTAATAAGADLHVVDIRDAAAVDAVFEQARPDVVFHMAAQIDIRVAVGDPALDASINVLGTIAVLEAARKAGVRRIVNTSTGGGLYGDADLLPTPETYEIAPMAPYGQSKLSAEGYCGLYTRLHGISSVSLRYGNVYGPRQDVHGEAGVVAIFCGHLVEGKTPTIYGDGRQTRDWVDVSDVVRANLLAADAEITGPVNIGHGQETSVLDLVHSAQRSLAQAAVGAEVRSRASRRDHAQLPGRQPGEARSRLGAPSTAARRSEPRARHALSRPRSMWPGLTGLDRPAQGLRRANRMLLRRGGTRVSQISRASGIASAIASSSSVRET